MEVLGAWYTARDFLDGDKPYAAVYALRSDRFAQKRAVEAMAAAASTLGVRNFKTLYKAYEEGKSRPAVDTYVISATSFTNQPAELNAGDWTADDFGVRRGTGSFEEVACPHPIMPTERIVNLDTGQEKFMLAWCKGGVNKTWRSKVVPRSQLASSREILKLADDGIMINGRTANALSDWIMDVEALNYDVMPERQSVSRLGWIQDGVFSPFVEGLLFDGEASHRELYTAATTPKGSFAGWVEAARAYRTESIAARIVLAASFASVLVKPMGALPFFVHLWGVDSSTGKTVALMAAASVWANPEMGKYVKTFDGTDVGYERTAEFLNSLPLCIDELQLAKNNRGQVVFNVYRLAQGAGRTRGNKSGGTDRTPTWSNAVLTTGETPLTSLGTGAGAVNRVIEIECTSEHKVVQDGRGISTVLKRNYGHAGRVFVKHLLEPGSLAQAERLYNEAFTVLNSAATTDKQAIAAALIVAADQLATEWFLKDDRALTTEEIAGFLASREAVSTGRRAYDYLCDWVAQNANRLKPEIDSGDVYGLVEKDVAYIINSVFTAACEAAGFNQKAVLSYLKGADLLLTDGNGKSTRTKRIRGSVTRCVALRLPRENDKNEYKPVSDSWPFDEQTEMRNTS